MSLLVWIPGVIAVLGILLLLVLALVPLDWLPDWFLEIGEYLPDARPMTDAEIICCICSM